jgi:glycosyltransferase involved in cell wall biosynthesis
LIVLVQPMYSKAELNSDSNYVNYSVLIRAMRRVRPAWHFVVIFPDSQSGYKYADDGTFALPNVTRVPMRISPRKMANAISYDATWYDQLYRKIGIDAVICNLPEIAGHLKHAGECAYYPAARPIIFAGHHYVIHESLPYPFHAMEHVAAAQVMGALQADWNIFNSDHCRQMLVETAGKWLRSDVIAGIVERSSKVVEGVLDGEDITPGRRAAAPERVRIVYNHRLQGYKNYRETFALFDELWRDGYRFSVRFTNSTAENTADIAHYPFVEIKLNATRREYLAALAECDLNVTNSQHETFCISAVESMAFGQPLIAPAGVTFTEITGSAHNGYPYLFRSRDEQKAMIAKLITDHAERQRWGQVVSDHVRTTYTTARRAGELAELVERKAPALPETPDDALAFFRETLERVSGCTARELFNAVAHKQVNGRAPFSSQSMTLHRLVRTVRHLGGRVTMSGGEQRCYAS